MTDLPEFVLERVFDAPRALVWRCWTDSDLLARWYGPNIETVIHALDPRPGGSWLNEMRWDGGGSFERMDYQDVVEPERLVWLHYTTDPEFNPAPNPMMPSWPRSLLTTVTFTEDGDKTRLRLTWVPHEASADEIAAFAQAVGQMGSGWGKGMEIIDKILAELNA